MGDSDLKGLIAQARAAGASPETLANLKLLDQAEARLARALSAPDDPEYEEAAHRDHLMGKWALLEYARRTGLNFTQAELEKKSGSGVSQPHREAS